MVRSLISQLSEQCVKVPTTFEMILSSCERGERYQTLGSFLHVLQQMVKEFSQTYIILDALDECASREELVGILNSMAGWEFENLHILVTSRNDPDVKSSLECLVEKQNIIWFQPPLVDKDMRAYIHQKLTKDKNLWKWQKNKDIRQEMEEALIKGAHGRRESLLF